MVQHSWILKCLEMVVAAKYMISIISSSMVTWKTVLTLLPLTLILRKMRAGYILAKDMKPINHLLFIDDLKLYGASKDHLDSLVQVVRIF